MKTLTLAPDDFNKFLKTITFPKFHNLGFWGFGGRDRYIDDYDDPSYYAQSRRGGDDYALSRRSTHRYSGRSDRRLAYHSD